MLLLFLSSGQRVPSPWTILATPKDLTQIDTGIADSLWGVDSRNFVYMYSNGQWELVDGKLKSVTAGESGVWGVAMDGSVVYRTGIYSGNPKGTAWTTVPIAMKLKKIESGPRGIVLGIESSGSVVHQLQYQNDLPTGLAWPVLILVEDNKGDKATDVSCGSYACWVITTSGSMLVGKGLTPEAKLDYKWETLPSDAQIADITSGFGGSVWGVSLLREVYKRHGVTALNPEGNVWQKENGVTFTAITTGLPGVFGLDDKGMIITQTGMHYTLPF